MSYNHFEYGQMLAKSLKDIQHKDTDEKYYRATEQDELTELDARLSGASGTILVSIDGSESTFGWENSDSLMELPIYSFIIASQTENGNSRSIFEAQQKCKKIAKQIISKMLQDYTNALNGLHLLEPSSFTMKGVGPIRENFYGVILFFSLNQGTDYRIDKTMWL